MLSRIVWIAVPVLILAAGVGGMTALVKSRPEREPLGVEERVWTVSAMAVAPGMLTPQLVLFALVDSPRTTRLSAAVSADVKAVEALEGQRVGPGDRLVALDDRDVRWCSSSVTPRWPSWRPAWSTRRCGTGTTSLR